MQKSPGQVSPIDDLAWFYWEAAAELGVHAQSYQPFSGQRRVDLVAEQIGQEIGGWYSMPVPGRRQMRAAARERQIRQWLTLLQPRHKSVIEVAYAQRNRGHLDYNGCKDLRRNFTTELSRTIAGRHAQIIRAAEQNITSALKKEDIEATKVAREKLKTAQTAADADVEIAVALLVQAHEEFIRVRGRPKRDKESVARRWLEGDR